MSLFVERAVGVLTYFFGLATFIWALVLLSDEVEWKFWPYSLLAFYFMASGVSLCMGSRGAVLAAHKAVAACLVGAMLAELAVTGGASDLYAIQLASLAAILLGAACLRSPPDVATEPGVPVTVAVTALPVPPPR